LCFMTVCMYRDIHTLQPYIIDFTQRGCHTLRLNLTTLVLSTFSVRWLALNHLGMCSNTEFNSFLKFVIITMTDRGTGVTSKHNYLNNGINFSGEIINIYIQKE